MYIKFVASILASVALMLPVAGHTADSEQSSASTMVKDSVITTKIKAELAAEKMSSLVNINVETDHKGAVTLGGTAASKSAVDKAVAIAKSVSLGAFVGAAKGAGKGVAYKSGWLADLVRDAVASGQVVLVAQTGTEEQTLIARDIIGTSVGAFTDTVSTV